MIRTLFLLCLIGVSGATACLAAESSTTGFDQANRLYEQGNYVEAINAYERLIAQKEISAAVYFNLGNAHFKSGQVGRAIACYRLAQRLEPRDPDIRANLRFARESVGGNSSEGKRWERALNTLTINELSIVTALFLWALCSVLALSQWRPQLTRDLRQFRIGLGVLTLLSFIWLGLVLEKRFGQSAVIALSSDAAVRYGPFDEAQVSFKLRDGMELSVVDRKENWLQIIDGAKRTGWVRNQDVLLLPPG